MAALGVTAATDIASAALIWYVKGKALSQTTQDKPLLHWLKKGSKSFASGNKQISEPVQFAYMSDTAGFVQGITGDDAISFASTSNLLRVVYNWYEVIMSLWITWTDLLIDGISIYDDSRGGRQSEHSEATVTRLTGILENRLDDFTESTQRGLNTMFWSDGSADAKQIPGLTALLGDSNTTGSVGGLSRVTYSGWRQRIDLTRQATNNADTMMFLNDELLQLRRYSGKPNKALCGSAWISNLRKELVAKGYFTQQGWQGEKATDLGMGGLHISGMGRFEYDPTLDGMGYSKRCYILDGRRIKFMPMEGEDMKVLTPERPYNYLVFLHNVKLTGALVLTQMNCHGIYGFA